MVSSFPSPLLTLAADAIQDLDGTDAITGLWSIFTKCKESIQDGPRLENISWRLWHRHLSAAKHKKRLLISPPPPAPSTYPLTPVSEHGVDHPACPASPALPNPLLTSSLSPTTTSPPLRRLAPVGKIICDIIPNKLDLALFKSPTRPPLPKLDPIIVTADPGAMVVTPVPSMILPPPSTPPPSAGLFPRVVVVNPTPHPTPPATPVPSVPPAPLPTTGQHLAPPARLFAALTRHNSPDATSPSNTVPTLPPCPPQLLAPLPVAAPAPPQPMPPLDPHPPPSQQPQPQPHPVRHVDETLKPSDRRFFLPQDQSPSPERDGPDRGSNGSISTGKSPSETGEPQPSSSLTSNQTRVSAASASSHPTGRGRRSKNPPSRPVLTRLNSGRHVPQVMRKDPTKPRLPFHLNPDKAPPKLAGSSRPPRIPVDPHPQPKAQTRHMNGTAAPNPPNPHNAVAEAAPTTTTSAAPRRGIVVSNSSSEYETTDTEEDDDEDDDSWASEGVSEDVVDPPPDTGTAGKHPPTDEIKLREAALEAQRQRELFVKQPKRSYSNLGRTQSGLLSQLLNPDPTMFPPGHPYRVASTHDVTRPAIPSALTSGKSAAAMPLAAQVTAQAPMVTATSSSHGGYRPKGRPQGEELEDDSDSPDDPDDTIQISRSLAQQRLAALANPSRRRASDNQVQTQASAALARPILPTVATAPIPLNHPWNLPAPAPPTTPRTTRRQMLATELSESLRRNLLWERQVSKTNLLGNAGRRNVLGGGAGGGSRPLTTVVVNGHGVGNAQAGPSQRQPQPPQQQPPPQQRQQHRQPRPGSGDGAEGSLAERRKRALARNLTWADDFHYAGW